MSSLRKRPVILGVLVGGAGLAAVLLAITLSGGSAPAASATTTSGHGHRNRSTVSAAQAWHNLAQCFRSHGYSIADPTVNADGTSSWSASTGPPPREVRDALRAVGEETCQAQFNALPPQALNPPPTPAELHALVLFARCMRAKGIADWPDPNSHGAFPLNARLLALGKRGILTQLRACGHILPGSGISIAGPKKNKR
jgi:hypothetical protein